MIKPALDVVAIGNAIVDILAPASDALIEELALPHGGMQLISASDAERLYARMGSAIEASGGSAANTIAGMAALGRKCGFIGQVANDQFGKIFSHDMRTNGAEFTTPPREGEPPTGQVLIFDDICLFHLFIVTCPSFGIVSSCFLLLNWPFSLVPLF